MKNNELSCNKNNPEQKYRCPISEAAAECIKKLSESYDDLSSAASRMAAAEDCPEFLRTKAWQRAERVGQVLDNLLDNWQTGCCSGLCFDCAWQNCKHGLEIINALTPCNQWFAPELWDFLSKNSEE